MAMKVTPFVALLAVLSMASTYGAFGIRCQNPCTGKKCPIYKEAVCKPVWGSKICPDAAFFVGGKKVHCGPGCLLEGACLLDACMDATCPAFPDAACVTNFCNGCKAEFYQDGKKVDSCDFEICLQNVICDVDPCDGKTCPAYPGAVCKPNTCVGCNAEFFLGEKKVDC